MIEEFRPIKDFPKHRISNFGNVEYYHIGNGKNPPYWRKLKGTVDRGYKQVGLRNNGKLHTRRIHHLVAEAFIGPRPDGMCCCHNVGHSKI